MYIEDRLFSERTEEVLYSVSMTEEEYDLYQCLFSEDTEEGSGLRTAGKIGLGAAGVVGFGALGNAAVSGYNFKKAAGDMKDVKWSQVKDAYKQGMGMSYKDLYKHKKNILNNGIARGLTQRLSLKKVMLPTL